MLKGSPFGIHQQFPATIEDRRKKMYPVMKRYKDASDRTKLVHDRLYINGRLYEVQPQEPNPGAPQQMEADGPARPDLR